MRKTGLIAEYYSDKLQIVALRCKQVKTSAHDTKLTGIQIVANILYLAWDKICSNFSFNTAAHGLNHDCHLNWSA